MYKEKSEIENLLLTYPISQLDMVLHDYIPASSNFRILLQSSEKKFIFIFKNCIEVHYTKRKKPLQKININKLESFPLNPRAESADPDKKISFIKNVRALVKETEEQARDTRWHYVDYSRRAAEWNLRLPAAMHEIEVITKNQLINLVFQEIKFEQKPLHTPVFQSA